MKMSHYKIVNKSNVVSKTPKLLVSAISGPKLKGVVHVSSVCQMVDNGVGCNLSIGLLRDIPDDAGVSERYIREGDL